MIPAHVTCLRHWQLWQGAESAYDMMPAAHEITLAISGLETPLAFLFLPAPLREPLPSLAFPSLCRPSVLVIQPPEL